MYDRPKRTLKTPGFMEEEDGYLLSRKAIDLRLSLSFASKLQDTLPQAYVLSRQLKTDSFVLSDLDLLLNKKFLIP
jgi:hypothetical protein